MGKYTKASERSGLGLRSASCPTGEDVLQIVGLTFDEDARVRRLALKNLCPCHVRRGVSATVWDRVFALTGDEDAGVRKDAIHSLIDGSPPGLADRVVETLEAHYNDPDPKVRRYVRRMRALQRRSGRVNVG